MKRSDHPAQHKSKQAPPASSRVAAFFDLDWTLLSINSGALWIEAERRAGRLTRWQHLNGIVYLLAYRLNVIDMQEAMSKALETIKGQPERLIRERTRRWYWEQVAHTIAFGAQRALDAHRQAGHRLVLLSSTSPYEAEVVCEHLSLDASINTVYQVRDGCFTGEVEHPLCYGSGKVARAERFAAEAGIDLVDSFFYTDSASDLPMLRRVGMPRAVNPDLALRLRALQQGWPILNWRTAQPQALPGLPEYGV